MPHAGIHVISAWQNKMNRRSGDCYVSCCRPAAISPPFTPLSTFRFQPLPAVATHGIDVDITFHDVWNRIKTTDDIERNYAEDMVGSAAWDTVRAATLNELIAAMPHVRIKCTGWIEYSSIQ